LIARATGVPWLADIRDGWTQNPAFFDPGNALAAALSRAGERFVARNATRIVTVSPPITRHLQSLRPPGLAPAVTIYNGFEPEECPGDSGEPASPLHAGRLTLLYTGTFFGRRRPDLFLHALARVVRRDPRWRDRLRVRLRCALDARERGLVERLGLAGVVEVLPSIPFRECLAEQVRADAFLLVLEHGPGSEIMVSQKVFEYLAARRPILALVPDGAAAELLADVGGATTCTSRRPGDAARALAAFLKALESGTHPLANPDRLATHTRGEQARAMAAELSAMAPRPRGSRRSASR
jgi:glycosyltransferase involved in cell wall biosynthesis